jgi:Serine phosphatase RsbU, regulator of sigma subunit
MQNKTMPRTTWTDKHRPQGSGRLWPGIAAAIGGGYVLANSFLFAGIAPFGVSLCAALQGNYVYYSALGAVFGSIFSVGHAGSKHIAAVLLVVLVHWLAEPRIKKHLQVPFSSLSALLGMGSAGLLRAALGSRSIYDLLLLLAETTLCGAAAYFFARSFCAAKTGIFSASRADLSCIVISFAMVLMGLSPIAIAGLSLGRILAILAILLAARFAGEAGGAVAGTTAGIAMGLAGGDCAPILSAYAFGGLLAGLFCSGGRLGAAISFLSVNALSAIFIGRRAGVYTAIFEAFIASVIFMVFPLSLANRLRLPSIARADFSASQTAPAALLHRLRRLSQLLWEIGDTTRKAGGQLDKLREDAAPAQIQTQAMERVCAQCGRNSFCWETHRTESKNAFAACARLLQKEGGIRRETLPAPLNNTCCKTDALIAEMNIQFQQQLSRQHMQRGIAQLRSAFTDQFQSLGVLLEELAEEFEHTHTLDAARLSRIKSYLAQQGLLLAAPLCYTDAQGHLHLKLTLPAQPLARLNTAELTQDLGDLLEVVLDKPAVIACPDQTLLSFAERAAYTLEFGAWQIACGGNRLCGDAYDYIRTQNGCAHFILSDGMGSGGTAAVDAAMATGLFARLLSAGVSHNTALRMVNSALRVKSAEESLATVDICTVDLFAGKAALYKAGAAPSFLLQGGRVRALSADSLPAGILRGVAFEKSTFPLQAGDCIVLLSDGATDHGTDWILPELANLGQEPLPAFCRRLAQTAQQQNAAAREDDITVLALRLKRTP